MMRRCTPIVLALAACAAASRSPAPVGSRPPAPEPELAFLDAHVHLNDLALQLDLMRTHPIEQAVVFWGRDGDNESIAAAAAAHPDRLIPFVSVSPERSAYGELWRRDDRELLAILERQLATGVFRGIGELSIAHFPARGFPETDFSPLSNTMRGIMELARTYRVPVMLHCEITRFRELAALLEAFPDVAVIWAHGGYTPLYLAQRMLDEHPNLYYELSARTWSEHPRSPDYTILRDARTVWPQWLALIESRPARFLVGTDAAHHSRTADEMKIAAVELLLRQLSPAARNEVARGTLLRLIARPRAGS